MRSWSGRNKEMEPRNFFSEVKRRNVYKVAVAYAVVAWLLIQAASILFPPLQAPPWVMKGFIAVVVLGFPVALVFSWAFEIPPQGIKRESEVAPDESITRRTGRKIVAMTILVALIAVGLFVYQLLRARLVSLLEWVVTAARTSDGLAGARPSIPQKSIAVLPFENLSRDPDNA